MAAGEERRRIAVRSRVGRVQRRLNVRVWLNAAIAPVWAGVTLLVLGRLFLPIDVPLLALPLLALVVVATTVLAAQKRVSLEQAAVVADRNANAGGLLLTRLETAVGEWELGLNQQLKSLPLPPFEVRKPMQWLALALTFAVAGLWVPRAVHPAPGSNVAAGNRVEKLADKVEALAKEQPVPEAIAAELTRLQNELDQNAFDATDWEAADSLDKTLDEHAAQASKALADAEHAAASLAKSLAEAQDADASAAKREALEDALMKLGDTASASSPSTENGASAGAQKKAPSSTAGAEALRDALAKRREELAKSFGQNAGKNGRQTAYRTGRGGEGEGHDPSGKGHASSGKSRPGKNAGAGHGDAPPAELVFGDEARIDTSRLGFEPLPKGRGGDEPGELLGLRAANPKPALDAPISVGTGAPAAGAQAAGHREGPLLPRNRALIERYFQGEPRDRAVDAH